MVMTCNTPLATQSLSFLQFSWYIRMTNTIASDTKIMESCQNKNLNKYKEYIINHEHDRSSISWHLIMLAAMKILTLSTGTNSWSELFGLNHWLVRAISINANLYKKDGSDKIDWGTGQMDNSKHGRKRIIDLSNVLFLIFNCILNKV